MNKKFSDVLPWAAMIVLGAGIIVTLYGFYSLATHAEDGVLWRWSDDYLLIFLVLLVPIAVMGIWRGPFAAGVLAMSLVAVITGVAVQVVVVMAIALSAYALGCLLLRKPDIAVTDSLLAGIVMFGTILGLLVHFPVNTSGTWGLLFALPILLGWRHVRLLWPRIKILGHHSGDIHLFLLQCAISAAALLHFLVSLMPEIGHDALAMHLFVPVSVAYNKVWNFDPGTYVWTAMPMLVDWLYTAGYLLAGETGARLVNLGSILLLATLVYRLALWAGAGKTPSGWAVLLLLVTPLTFTESSSLFVEGIWSVLVLGGTFALLRIFTNSEDDNIDMPLAGVLLGGALAAKAVTFTILPVLGLIMIVGYRRWFSKRALASSAFALFAFLVIGGIPYATAYVLTGNPVFPFFNAYFQSSLYPVENFNMSSVFARGFAWDTFYDMTFHSGQYMESTPGASGFQWLLLVIPAIVALTLGRQRRALLLVMVMVVWIWLAFWQLAYLRYVFPSFSLACVVVAAALSIPALNHGWMRYIWTTVSIVAVVLNILHFNAGTYYGEINFRILTDLQAREAYIERNVPVRWAAGVVNDLNFGQAPVAFFSAPLTAGLKSDALYPSWYNWRFYTAMRTATNGTEMARLLAQNHVRYVVIDEKWELAKLFPLVKEATKEVARNQTVSVRRIDRRAH